MTRLKPGKVVEFGELVHRLCREPHAMRPKDVGELTVFQARNLLESREGEAPRLPPMPSAGGKPGTPPAAPAAFTDPSLAGLRRR